MFGIGLPELILIMIVALLVVGPKKLPELARSVGKALHQVKSMTDDVKQSFEEVTTDDLEELRKTEEARDAETTGGGEPDGAGTDSAGEPFAAEPVGASEHDMIEFPVGQEADEEKQVQTAGAEQGLEESPQGRPGTGGSGGQGNLRG